MGPTTRRRAQQQQQQQEEREEEVDSGRLRATAGFVLGLEGGEGEQGLPDELFVELLGFMLAQWADKGPEAWKAGGGGKLQEEEEAQIGVSWLSPKMDQRKAKEAKTKA
jgi:hypothetical protein